MAVLLPESPLRPDRDEVSTSDKTLLHSLYLVTLLRSVILSYGGSLIALALCVPALMFGAVARHTDWGVTRYGQCHGAPDASAAKFVLPLCLKHLTPPAVSLPAGGCDYDAALEYIKWKFMNVRKDKSKQIYVMETTATDTKNMEFIIKSMVDIVEKQNLAQSGFS